MTTATTASPAVDFLSLGPGDPDQLTLGAVRALREADVVVVPATEGAAGAVKSRARDIISPWVADGRMRLYPLPMSAERQAVRRVYDRMAADIAAWHGEGRRVAVCVEGDASVYASIHYVLEQLQTSGVPVRQLAGVPSFIAAAASAGLSLICQRERLVVLPGDADIEVLRRLLTDRHVVVVMKLSACQQVLKDYLLQHPDTECHYFENVGTPDAYHTSAHDEILARQMPYFSLCILYPA